MINLFSETNLKRLNLKNHFFRSATHERKSTVEGHLTQEIMDIYERLSNGGVGTIITGYAYVTKREQPSSRMMGIYSDVFIDEYKKLTEMVHSNNTKIVMQLVYGGSVSQANPENKDVWGPTEMIHPKSKIVAKEMSEKDIEELVNYFTNAALRAKKSNFDGIQIHAAHGYLLSQFLSPLYNKRVDEYGGILENRVRIITEIISSIREVVGEDFLVMIKINALDGEDGGLTYEESLKASKILSKCGVDAIEVSGGTFANYKVDLTTKPIYLDYAVELSQIIDIPVILTGGMRNLDIAHEIANTTKVNLFGISRPIYKDPEYLNKLKDDYLSKHE